MTVHSTDGKKFTKVGEAKVQLKDVRAGVMACEGVRPSFGGRGFNMPQAQSAAPVPMQARFDWFHIK